jgi:hypothetical protein
LSGDLCDSAAEPFITTEEGGITRNALLLFFTVMLALPSAFCSSSLLRLERSDTPQGPWEEVPANTLPVTAEGAFQDTYESATGYYHMRIDPGDEWGFPLNIPLEDVAPLALDIARQLLQDWGGEDGDNAWEDAVLGDIVFPIYSPLMDGPAYMEFKVQMADPRPTPGPLSGNLQEPSASPPVDCNRNRGFILVSLTDDGPPVIDYSTEGCTRTECLRKYAGSSAVRIFRYDDTFMAAENEKGEKLAQIGTEPVRYPDELLDYLGQEFEGYIDEQGEETPKPPPFEGEPYKSYQDFKEDYLKGERFKVLRENLKEESKVEWEILRGQHEEVINTIVCNETLIFADRVVLKLELADPTLATFQIQNQGVLIHGKKAGVTTMTVEFQGATAPEVATGLLVVSEGALSPEQPTGWTSWTSYYAGSWSDQRRYTQVWGGSCWSGCGATAWAMLYGWFDYTGAATNLISGTAPLYNNSSVEDCIWYVVDRVGTYCAGSQGATNPWNMYKGYKWAQYRGCGYSVSYVWSVPCIYSSSARNKARDSIKNDDRPTIIGIGCSSAHYPLAYGYKYRDYRVWGVTWSTQRRFKCNMGWGGSSAQWKNAKVWYGQRNNFW